VSEPDLRASDAEREAVVGRLSTAVGGTQWHVTPLGGLRRTGAWRVAPRTVAVTLIGGTDLDLGEAQFAAPAVTLTKVSLIGGVRVSRGTR
jgi:hypothetical protein